MDRLNIGRAPSPLPRSDDPQPGVSARPAGHALPEHAALAPRRGSQGSAPRQPASLTTLPLELLQQTGSYLSDKDLAALAGSSRQMHAAFVDELDKRHGVAHHEAAQGLQQLLRSFGSSDTPARDTQALRDDVSRWARRLRPERLAPAAAAFVSQALHGIAPQQAAAALHASLEMAQSLPFGPQGQVLKTVLQSHQLNRLRDPQEAEAVFTEMRNATLSHLDRPEFMGLFKALVHDQLPQLPTEVGQRMQQRFQALLPHLRPGERREMQQILAQGEKLAATAAGIRDVRARIAALNPRR